MPRMSLNERARHARKREGLIPQEAAERIGCSRPTVLRWEKDAASISGEYLMAAARVYRVRPDWLTMKSDDDGYPWSDGAAPKVRAFGIRAVDGEDGVDPATDALIPIYDIEVSAGDGATIPDFIETKYRLPFQINWLNDMGAKPEDILVAKVRGASMEPVLYDGDKVVIHRGRQRVKNDCVYSLVYGGEARVKRLFRLADGSLRIVSDNPDKTRYPDELVQPADIASVHIIGQVIDKMGSGGLGF